MSAEPLDTLTAETLTTAQAEAILGTLRPRCAAWHRRHVAGITRAVCVCGASGGGPTGGEACARLRRLYEGGDEAAWLLSARALRDLLAADEAAAE